MICPSNISLLKESFVTIQSLTFWFLSLKLRIITPIFLPSLFVRNASFSSLPPGTRVAFSFLSASNFHPSFVKSDTLASSLYSLSPTPTEANILSVFSTTPSSFFVCNACSSEACSACFFSFLRVLISVFNFWFCFCKDLV